MAQYMAYGNVKRRGQGAYFSHARGQIRMFDFIFAQILFDQKQGIRNNIQFFGPQFRGLD